MDKIDKKLIYHLTQNCRITNKELSGLTKISPEAVRQRIERLQKQDIIRNFISYINLSQLQFTPYQLFIKLKITAIRNIQNIIIELKQLPFLNWIGVVKGKYDLGIIFSAKNQIDFETNYDEIREILQNKVESQDISMHVKGVFYNREYLLNKKQIEGQTKYAPAEYQLNELDIQILNLLSTNARAPIIEISKKLDISPITATKRLKLLQKSNILTGFTIHFNPTAAQIQQFKILLTVKNWNSQIRDSIISYLNSNTHVIAFLETFASWHFEIDFETLNQKEYDHFFEQLLHNFDSQIADITILQITDMPTYRFLVS